MPPEKTAAKQQPKTQKDTGASNLSATLNATHSDEDESAPTQHAVEDKSLLCFFGALFYTFYSLLTYIIVELAGGRENIVP